MGLSKYPDNSILPVRALFCRIRLLALIYVLILSASSAWASSGAAVPWTTYEAEAMAINGGTIMGPPAQAADKNVTYANTIEGEASGRQYVKLTGTGQYVEFTAQSNANAIVVRYCVADSANGTGIDSTISLYLNGVFAGKLPVTSKYSWRYGNYTFSNNPGDGKPRNFFDEVRTNGLVINAGDTVRIQKDADDSAAYDVIDLVDLENVAAPLTTPANSLSIISYGAMGNGVTDCTVAFQNCINAAKNQGKTVWLPAGDYVITGNINLPSSTTVQGAGMWYTTLLGDASIYNANSADRITLNGGGGNVHLSDFAITGKLNYRNDSEPNDGLGGSFGTGSTISRVWVEHTKTGAWLVNSSGLVVDNCRFRNTIADGINFCVGMRSSTITNCTARGTGDDCFAIWPATYTSQTYTPGLNLITHCTGQVPNLANGGAIYGGVSNRIEDCAFIDMPYGCGILISGTFPIGANVFSGTTIVQRCDLIRCGGYDPGWLWRGALTLCPQDVNISGVQINALNISNSLSYAVQIVSPGSGVLSNATLSSVNVSGYGVAVPPYHPAVPSQANYVDGVYGVLARNDAKGSLTVSDLTVNGTPVTSVPASGTDLANQSSGQFTFNFLTLPITVTVQPSSAGHSFTVDGTNYTVAQSFNWTQASVHTIGTLSPQNSGTGVQDVWTSWSDGGAISHTITSFVNTTYMANFTTQYYLTMNSGTGGSVIPGSGWNNSGTDVSINAIPFFGFNFTGWTGSGSGSYSGNNDASYVTMNGPITETASFTSPQAVALAFTMQPGSAVMGVPFGQQPVLKTVDASGNPTTINLPDDLTVNVTLTNGSGTLSGTTIYNIGASGSNGVVTFNDLSIDAAGSGNQLVALTTVQTGNPLPGAVLWLDASDASTLMTNAMRVQAWKNKGSGGAGTSGTNLWFTQNMATLQPWLTNQLNGRPVVTFNKNGNGFGAGCTFLGNLGKNSYTNSGNQMTYFIVARQSETTFGWQAPVSFSTTGQVDGQGAAGIVILADGSQSVPFPLGIQRNHPATPMQADVAVPIANTAFELTFVDNAGAANLYLNESSGLSRSNNASIVNGISPYKYGITDVTVGGRLEPDPTTVDNGWDGDVAEVLVYNTALSASDRTAVENYLAAKWFTPNADFVISNAVSAPFTVQSSPPPSQNIFHVTVGSNSIVTLAYATTPGFLYHVEVTTNLSPAHWITIDGSVTNASGTSVILTDTNQSTAPQRYYRTVSP